MTIPIHFFRDLRLSTLSLILLVAFAGIAGCRSDNSPDVMVSPPGWVADPLRRPACDVRHADLHFQRRNQFLRQMPRCGPLRRDLEGFLLRKPRGLPPRSGRELGHPLGSRGDRQEGPGQFRVRLLPDLPRGGLPDAPRRCEQNLLLLPQPGPAPERAVALLRREHALNTSPSNAPCVPAATGTVPRARPIASITRCATRSQALRTPWGIPPGMRPRGPAPGRVDNGAKAAPGSTTGFLYCQACHGTGTDFAGGSSGSPAPTVPTPRVTGPGSLPRTRRLRGAAPRTPTLPPTRGTLRCRRLPTGRQYGRARLLNNTLCHAQPGAPHPVGNPAWYPTPRAAQPHGSVDNGAKAAPGSTTGFLYCKACHGTGRTSRAAPRGSPAPTVPTPRVTERGRFRTRRLRGAAPRTPTLPPTGERLRVRQLPPERQSGRARVLNNTLCHAQPGAVAHSIPYNDASHYAVTSTTFTGNCGGCHDVSAPSAKAGPVCQTCHVAASPLTAANCTSCHASPPTGGAGAAYANIAGAHSVHLGLNSTGSPVSCNTCHNALGPSLLDNNHYNRAKSRVEPGDVAFLTSYSAESGTSSFNSTAFSCSNVSCHGGVAGCGGIRKPRSTGVRGPSP